MAIADARILNEEGTDLPQSPIPGETESQAEPST
jgi:hypothetical protein